MSHKTRIAILGIGGVGGYFGGLLAEKYFHSDTVEIIFITRPATEKIIREKGLKLITDAGERIIFPDSVTSNPAEIGKLDCLICCTKSYSLEESLMPLKNCIDKDTVILPLYNGVDARERIEKLYPGMTILDGCAYIVARLLESGVVKVTGNIHHLYFGSDSVSGEKLNTLQSIFLDANIDSRLSENTEESIWEKFLFISPLASLTSYLDTTIGPILENEEHKKLLLQLIAEVKSVAGAKNISLSDDIINRTISKMEKLPYDATSSMHHDFKKGGSTEYLSLTEYVSSWGKKLNIQTPVYDMVLEGLKKRSI